IGFRGVNLLAGSEEHVRVRPRPKGPPKLIPSDSHLKRHRARMNKVRGRGMSMVFQEPMSSLNPVLRVGYQVAEVIMFQRRQELCDRILSHRSLTAEDRDLFRQAIVTLDPAERDRIVAGLACRPSQASRPAKRPLSSTSVPPQIEGESGSKKAAWCPPRTCGRPLEICCGRAREDRSASCSPT